MKILKTVALACLFSFSGISAADGAPPVAQQEISHLFAYLKSSGCQFNRNGTWYSPQEAADHLDSKYQYLLGKGRITSAEDFISDAASKSSMSGEPYLVKCGDAPPVESGGWFRAELERYRKPERKASNSH
jgi:hypothetical protein